MGIEGSNQYSTQPQTSISAECEQDDRGAKQRAKRQAKHWRSNGVGSVRCIAQIDIWQGSTELVISRNERTWKSTKSISDVLILLSCISSLLSWMSD